MSSTMAACSLQGLQIRSLTGSEDFQSAEQVQIETWAFRELDVVPAAIFSVAHNFGGQALGAFEKERMVGFALSFGAVEQGHTHFHSHMVAVVPDYQNRGLGQLIKRAQREDAIRRGVDQIVWTFDPLQLRNAYFNITRLGGVGVRYLPDLYGNTSSPLHGGIPTDRLVVEWNLVSRRVLRALDGEPPTRGADSEVVAIPRISNDFPVAERVAGQKRLRERLMKLLAAGYLVTGFEQGGDTSNYVLEKR